MLHCSELMSLCQCRTLNVFCSEYFYTSDLCLSVAVIAPSLFTSFLCIFKKYISQVLLMLILNCFNFHWVKDICKPEIAMTCCFVTDCKDCLYTVCMC